MAFDTWESCFYPPPDEGTLRNLFDERDPVVLTRLEYVETARRQRELLAGQVAIPKTYDADHVRAIHRHLFQDVYAWAGEFRSVNISKGAGRGFGDVKTGEVDQLLDDVRKRVAGTDWGRLDRDTFAERAATVFAYLNQAHPFREGNGRTGKVFMEHVAERSRFTLDFGQVTPDVWNQASQLSRPDMFSYAPEPASLVPVFRAIAAPRTSGPSTSAPPGPGRSAARASYPRAATQATNQPPQTGPQRGPQARHGGPYMPGRGSGTGQGR
ncbi:Fic/DOC family protein [Arsenicicoccus sp. UBA2120]|uniref:Fic/DOC family protein n=1 Tax=Arsenicicoccus sp. UBA2120 TaxID=1946055 RepID=UPI00257A0CB6|nr:Fic family protein [Arsenicicoccus sp. UBA2120]